MKRILLVCLLSAGLLTGCSSLLARTSRATQSPDKGETMPQRGLQVTQVFSGSTAEGVGMHPMDVISKYGEFEILDDAGFYAARNHYEAEEVRTVEIVFWRGLTRMSARVRPGRLGISSQDYDKTSQKFMSYMREIIAMRELPQYMIDAGVYKFKGSSPSDTLMRAKDLIDQGERDGTLTPAQILLYRIYLIPDDAPAEELQRLEGLLQQLIASQPPNYIHYLGSDKFFKIRAVALRSPVLRSTSKDSATMFRYD